MKTKNILIKIISGFLVIVIGISFVFISTQVLGKLGDEKKGLVTYKDGRVKKKTVVAEDWENAEVNTAVNSGDRVRTYTQSRAELELLDLDVIRMAPETTIDIVKLFEETKGKVKETKIMLQQGDIWANVEKKDTSMKFDISTPVAGAAITGTVFRMQVKPDSSTELKVYTGEVKVSNVPENVSAKSQQKLEKPSQVPGPHEVPGPQEVSLDQWVYIIKNMQKILIGGDGRVKSVSSFSNTDSDEQTDWVRWNLNRDTSTE